MASWFEQVAFKLHGAQNWPWTEATVFDYTLGVQGRGGARRAELSYSFWIEGHIYSGVAVWQDLTASDYSKNDLIQIQYNPSEPNESYFPEREDVTTTFFLTLIGTAALLAMLIWLGSGLLRNS